MMLEDVNAGVSRGALNTTGRCKTFNCVMLHIETVIPIEH